MIGIQSELIPQSSKIELAANFWIRAASVGHIVAVERHHVAHHVSKTFTICNNRFNSEQYNEIHEMKSSNQLKFQYN